MDTLAKILGMLCMVTAAVIVALGIYVYVEASGAEDTTGIADVASVAYLAGSVGTGVLLGTFGVTAWVVGDLSARWRR